METNLKTKNAVHRDGLYNSMIEKKTGCHLNIQSHRKFKLIIAINSIEEHAMHC